MTTSITPLRRTPPSLSPEPGSPEARALSEAFASVLLDPDCPVEPAPALWFAAGSAYERIVMAGMDAVRAASCPHYFVKEGGRWVCTMCGATR